MTNRIFTAIGLMSGTSLDGVDAALVRTDGESLVEPGPWMTAAYPSQLRDGIRELLGKIERTEAVVDIERALTQCHTDIINKLLEKNAVTYSKNKYYWFPRSHYYTPSGARLYLATR